MLHKKAGFHKAAYYIIRSNPNYAKRSEENARMLLFHRACPPKTVQCDMLGFPRKKEIQMKKKRYSEKQIVKILLEAEKQEKPIAELCKALRE